MKIHGTPKAEGTYAEIPQNNKLRWVILKKREDGDFEVASAIFKCKDFFNDVVASYHGKDFSIYSFDAAIMPKYDEGVYVQLLNVHNLPAFQKNVRSINSMPGACGNLDVIQLEDGNVVMLLPRVYFDTTWQISLLTYLIRVSNVDVIIDDWFKHPTLSTDNPFKAHFAAIMKAGFNVPVKNLKAYYYFGTKQGAKDAEAYHSSFHNNGCWNWMNAVSFNY